MNRMVVGVCTLWLMSLCAGTASGAVSDGEARSIINPPSTLTIRVNGERNVGIDISTQAYHYVQPQPCAVDVVEVDGSHAWIAAPYVSFQELDRGAFRCMGSITSRNGSTFSFSDTYSSYPGGCFQVARKVIVTVAKPGDKGFSTRMVFARAEPSALKNHDCFAPGIWYKDNGNVHASSLAPNLAGDFYWFREDRMPLPLFMLRDKECGATFSICHINPDGSTFAGEDGLNRVIDGRMKFAALGLERNAWPLVGMVFPGSEGERTGIFGFKNQSRWALRSHPVQDGFVQEYAAMVRLSVEADYASALKNTWAASFNAFRPSVYACDMGRVYSSQLGLLHGYWKEINGSSGFPFRVHLDGVADDADYNWNMGFVGMQLPNASVLLRQGILLGDQSMIAKAEKTVDFWAENALTGTGCPRTWFNPQSRTWRTVYPTFSRVIGDGMTGMLWAWSFERKRGIDKPLWIQTCCKTADWLVARQNADGSFSRAYDFRDDSVKHPEKTNTSHVIPFLVDMFKVTGSASYQKAARKAGEYIFADIHQAFNYIGGTPDNPNVPDKEAASMALRAFLALFDLDRNAKWIDAASQAAYYYETWVYAWSPPIPADDLKTIYPKNRSMTGLSLIATGNNGCDTYAAIDAFNFYRVYLLRGDPHLFQFAKFLLNNTRQAVNWNAQDPIPGYGANGIMMEAMTAMIPRGHGVRYYLPWQTYNMIEPLVLLWDVFKAKSYDLDVIEGLPNRKALHDAYISTRNLDTLIVK